MTDARTYTAEDYKFGCSLPGRGLVVTTRDGMSHYPLRLHQSPLPEPLPVCHD